MKVPIKVFCGQLLSVKVSNGSKDDTILLSNKTGWSKSYEKYHL